MSTEDEKEPMKDIELSDERDLEEMGENNLTISYSLLLKLNIHMLEMFLSSLFGYKYIRVVVSWNCFDSAFQLSAWTSFH